MLSDLTPKGCTCLQLRAVHLQAIIRRRERVGGIPQRTGVQDLMITINGQAQALTIQATRPQQMT